MLKRAASWDNAPVKLSTLGFAAFGLSRYPKSKGHNECLALSGEAYLRGEPIDSFQTSPLGAFLERSNMDPGQFEPAPRQSVSQGAPPAESPRTDVGGTRFLKIPQVLKKILPDPNALVSGGKRDNALDGIRALAVLFVFGAHATYSHLLPPILNFRGAGRAGVVLFFFLSAFLISGPFFREPRKALTWQAWPAYGSRRLFRIVPLYFLALIALFLLGLAPLNNPSWSENTHLLAQHLTFQKGFSVFWTIIVEMRFYVVLPILLILSAVVLAKLKNGGVVLILLAGFWIVGVATGVIQDGYLRTLGVDKHAPVFIAGILTALLFHTLKTDAHNRTSKILFECLAWASAIAFVCLSVPAVYYAIEQGSSISGYAETRSPVLEAFWDARIPWIGLVLGLFFFSYPNGTGLMSGLFSWPALVWIGRVSFGVYLIHLTVIQLLVRFHLPDTVTLILALAFSVGIASLLFMMLEAPMISLGHRLSARLRPDAGNKASDSAKSARGAGTSPRNAAE